MNEYVTGLELITQRQTKRPISTGSPELDSLLGGGIHRSLFHHFYGEDTLIETLLQHLTVNALKPNEKGSPTVCYMLCSNYRKERVNLATDKIAELAEDSGFNAEEALRRLQVFTASSADQQAHLADTLREFLTERSNVSLVIVHGVYKLSRDDARLRNRHVVWEEVQRSICRLSQTCAERGIPMVASGREAAIRGRLLPQPESSSYLRHAANVIVYLRRRGGDSQWSRALLVDHPALPPATREYHYEVNRELGRETVPLRQSFQDTVERLRRGLREALVSRGRRAAFDQLSQAWDAELGAVTYTDGFKLLDLLLIVSDLENRSLLGELEQRVSRLERMLHEGEGLDT